MAKLAKAAASVSSRAAKPKKKRPGVHAKCKTDSNKKSKHWKKPYRGQGR
jgi:hypothetical protein